MSDVVARCAVRHVHVLPVEVPGHWQTRARLERALLARGWRLSPSPADADLLAVCGQPGPRLDAAVELVWQQMPGPRSRVTVADDSVATWLDQGRARLLDTAHQRQDTRGHEVPGDIPLAEGGEDRDLLEMDVLDVRLGPVLSHWPAGLVLRGTMHGDVIADARAELLDTAPAGGDAEAATSPARTLDNIGSLLLLAGWEHAGAAARRARDAVLAGDDREAAAKRRRLHRRVARSRLLRWSLRDLGPVDHEYPQRHGLPPRLGGDTWTRLLGMLDRAGGREVVAPLPVTAVAPLVNGLDVAAARLVIASLDIHRLAPAGARVGGAHG